MLFRLPIYNKDVPWQCRVESNLSAQAAVFFDQSKHPVGYVLYNQKDDKTKQTSFLQFELLETITQDEFLAMLSSITDGASFSTVNTPLSSRATTYFINLNTEEIIRQVWMEKEMDNGSIAI